VGDYYDGRTDDSENSRAFVDKRQELCLRIKGTTDKVKNNMLVRRKKDRKSRWRAGSDEEKRENALGFCSF
jgi:hypothetical protein